MPGPPCARRWVRIEAGALPLHRKRAGLKPPFCTGRGLRCVACSLDPAPYTWVMAQVTTVLIPRRAMGSKLKAYLALTKPRIIELLLITTLPTMVVAAKGRSGLVAYGRNALRRSAFCRRRQRRQHVRRP